MQRSTLLACPASVQAGRPAADYRSGTPRGSSLWRVHAGHDVDLTTVSRVEQAVMAELRPPDASETFVLLPGERPAADTDRLLRMCRSRPGHGLRHPRCRWALAAATGGIGVAGVQGLVMDTGGAPPGGIAVTIAGSGKTVAAKTDSSGQFRALLESGDYRISIDPAHARRPSSTVR